MQAVSSRSKSFDSRLAILILQISAVGIVILFAVFLRLFGGDVYNKISVFYHENFDDITDVNEVLDPEGIYKEETESEHNVTDNNTENESEISASGEDEGTLDSEEENDAGYVTGYDEVKSAIPVVNNTNTFLWPVAEGTITSEYGYRKHPITDEYSMHGGIDIGAKTGTEISSAYGGTVTATGYSDSYGYYVLITHSDSVQTMYAHCSKIVATKGESVQKGETIALVGSTGRSTGPHLHFEIRIGGNRINPRWILGDKTEV